MKNAMVMVLDKMKNCFKKSRYNKHQLQIINKELRASIDQMITVEREILWQKKYFEALFKNSTDAIVLFDENHHIVDINKKFTEIFDYSLEEIKGKDLDKIIANDEKIEEANALTRDLLNGKEASIESIRYKKGGIPIDVGVKGVMIIIEEKVVGGYGIYTDITKQKETEKEILYITFHDVLTGVYNRAFFERELKRIDNIENLPITIIMGDVNGLKVINDAFGHDEGDVLLKHIASIFARECGIGSIVARTGGDEFAVLLPQKSEEEAIEISKNIKDRCLEESKGPIRLSVSLGVATKLHQDQSLKKVYKLAEDRMYSSKLLESKSVRNSIIDSLRRTLQKKTHETHEHTEQLVQLSLELGKRLGLEENKLRELKLLGLLHDIGKIAIPEDILTKKEGLTDKEWETMKKHCEIGYRIASASPELIHIAEGILQHHERWDGRGYPQGLKEEAITIEARIIAIVDAYDAMTSDRPYRKALNKEGAIEEIKKEEGKQFDPHITEVFLSIVEELH